MKKRLILTHWIPMIAWMLLIFTLSSRQRISPSEIFAVNFLIFKTLHVLEYALLYFLVFRALYRSFKLDKKKIFILAILFCIFYAISDEVHQTFVPTREGAVRDVFIDTIGILLSFSYTKFNLKKLKLFI